MFLDQTEGLTGWLQSDIVEIGILQWLHTATRLVVGSNNLLGYHVHWQHGVAA